MPKAISNTIIANLTQFADKAKGLSALGAVVLLFTTTAMMGMIERVFNQIWRVRRPRPLMQRMLTYWALITLGPLLFGLSISLTAQLFTATGGMTRAVPFLGTILSTLASLALTTGAYTLLYVAVPNRYVDWRDALWGALAAAIAFELAKRLFALFIRQFPTYAHHLRRPGRAAAVPDVDVFLVADHLAGRGGGRGPAGHQVRALVACAGAGRGVRRRDGGPQGAARRGACDRFGAGVLERDPRPYPDRLRRTEPAARADGGRRLGRPGAAGRAAAGRLEQRRAFGSR